jgi:uncharacterized protein (DUF2062 family)
LGNLEIVYMKSDRNPRRWVPTRESLLNNRWLKWLHPFLHHPRLWHWSRRGVATGVAIGVFFGLLIPIAQIPLSAAAAILLRANVPAAAASTLVTNPVTFGPIYYAAYQLGLALTGETAAPDLDQDRLAADEAAQAEEGFWSRITQLGKPLLVGLVIMATLTGLATYAIITLIWRWRVLAKRRRRTQMPP